MSELTVKTNNRPRDPLYWYDLTDKEKREFDWISEDSHDDYEFIRYRGAVYCLSEFMTTQGMPEFSPIRKWDGYHSDSFYSGIVIKYVDDGMVIVGTFFS